MRNIEPVQSHLKILGGSGNFFTEGEVFANPDLNRLQGLGLETVSTLKSALTKIGVVDDKNSYCLSAVMVVKDMTAVEGMSNYTAAFCTNAYKVKAIKLNSSLKERKVGGFIALNRKLLDINNDASMLRDGYIVSHRAQGAVAHEVGHAVMNIFNNLAARSRSDISVNKNIVNAYHSYYKDTQKLPAISIYGATNVLESFAESFSAYVCNMPRTGPSQKRFETFMTQAGMSSLKGILKIR